MNKARVIAFYLPQYYPTDTNNKNYGEGFTEWTNVRKAVPLFSGHYQPKVPSELGYYDLRQADVREKQAKLAKEAGIEGFCYYHYWFGEGRQELELPFSEVVASHTPEFPFCLCWANQSWYAKFWNKDANPNQQLIIAQKYDNNEWIDKHFYSLLQAFKDARYIRVEGKLLFMIYRPLEYPDVKHFIKKWQKLASENHLDGFFFVGQATNDNDVDKLLAIGFDGVNIIRKSDYLNSVRFNNVLIKYWNKFQRLIGNAPYHYDYRKIYKSFIQPNGMETKDNVFPTLLPNWDHSPRSGKRGEVFYNSTPASFKKHAQMAIDIVSRKPYQKTLVFLKSWNEWGEGNYMEPDVRYGRGYIDALRDVLCHR